MPTADPKSSTESVRRTRRALLRFYDERRRDLPWRAPSDDNEGRPDPYRVWISEVMLQQTRVDAVLPYYRTWMVRFPDLNALAGAPLDDVLKAWEGLGYYARARNLHAAAAVVRERLGGAWPRGSTGLRALPGVGEYTAGAVASIAFGERVPAVDGNVRRVLARLYDEPVPSPAWLRERATELVDPRRPGDFNQALMELGATVCTPRGPSCETCPVARDCRARAVGTVASRPTPRTRGAVPRREMGVAVLTRDGHDGPELLLVRRPTNGLLGGLWEMPTAEATARTSPTSAARAAARAAGVAPRGTPASLSPVRHVYSHFEGWYRPFLWHVVGSCSDSDSAADHVAWVGRDALERRALTGAHRRIAAETTNGWER